MNLNQDQRKHFANVLHTLAIAFAVPAFLKLVGFNKDLDIGYVIIAGLIVAFFVLEYYAIVTLKPGDNNDDDGTS